MCQEFLALKNLPMLELLLLWALFIAKLLGIFVPVKLIMKQYRWLHLRENSNVWNACFRMNITIFQLNRGWSQFECYENSKCRYFSSNRCKVNFAFLKNSKFLHDLENDSVDSDLLEDELNAFERLPIRSSKWYSIINFTPPYVILYFSFLLHFIYFIRSLHLVCFKFSANGKKS